MLTMKKETTVAHAAEKLGLGDVHAVWLAKLEGARPSTDLLVPAPDALSALLTRLDVVSEDASEVLRTMPSPERDPELWWLLERSHNLFVSSLAGRDSQPNREPVPPLPEALGLFSVHLILVSVTAIRQRQQEFGVPEDISWETLSWLGRAMAAY